MSQYFTRNKPKSFLLRILYFLNRIIKISDKQKLNIYLDLAWIFHRLSHETAIKYYSSKGMSINRKINVFLLNKIHADYSILDLGCNLGEISFELAKVASHVIGIDQNEVAIKIAKSKYKLPNLEFLNEEAFSYLSENGKKMDVLILSHILEHLDNPAEFILKFKSYFKLVYVEVPDLEATVLNRYRIDLNANFRYMDDDHLVEFDREDLKKFLSNSGLTIIDSEYIYGIQRYWCVVN